MLIIQKRRKARKMKQIELSKLTGIKCSTLSQYETGKRKPTFETLKKIAQYLNCTVDDLIEVQEKK